VHSRPCAILANRPSSNLLFPREDKAENKLLFACRTCDFAEEAPSSCVMRHEIASTVGDTAGVTAEVGQDPTVGLTRSLSRTSLDVWDAFPHLCTMCGQEIVCEECGEETVPGYVLETMDEHAVHTDAPAGDDKHSSKT
jgi:DNA-directed RNA polymerase II subunit RPB9